MLTEMKDSRMEWIGEIPSSWNLVPIRAVFQEVNQKNYDGSVKNALKFTYGEIVPKESFDSEDAYVTKTIRNYNVVEPGTIMLNGLNLNFDFVTQRIGLVKNKGIITSSYMAFKPSDALICSEYATYLFKAYDGCKALHNMGGGVRKILNYNEFKKYYVPLPSISEQKTIVAFLDSKCTQINKTIDGTKEQIKALEEYKTSIITNIVNVGKMVRFKYIATIRSNLVNPSNYLSYLQIGPDSIEKNTGKLIIERTVEEAAVDSWNHLFFKGQIIYSKIRPVLNKVIIAPYDGLCSADMYPIETKQNTRFLKYAMLSSRFVYQVDMITRDRIKMPKINQDELGNIKVLIPELDEQDRIADYLDGKCAEIDKVIADKRKLLTLLDEYKKSLIYEYVTGKKEVPAT